MKYASSIIQVVDECKMEKSKPSQKDEENEALIEIS